MALRSETNYFPVQLAAIYSFSQVKVRFFVYSYPKASVFENETNTSNSLGQTRVRVILAPILPCTLFYNFSLNCVNSSSKKLLFLAIFSCFFSLLFFFLFLFRSSFLSQFSFLLSSRRVHSVLSINYPYLFDVNNFFCHFTNFPK